MISNPKTLTAMQETFCLEYVKTGNASEAYRHAYPNSKTYLAKTVWEKASQLMANGKVKARIEDMRAQVIEKTAITEARVIEEVARIGLFDPASLFNKDGGLIPIAELAPEVRAAIASIEVDEIKVGGAVIGQVKKVKFWDKNSALEKLMKHLGSFERDNKQRAGLFDNVPRDTMRMIEDKLRGLTGIGVAGGSQPGSPSRFTH